MSLVKKDHVIETLAANATNHPFDVRILPRRSRRRPNLVDAEAFDAPDEVRTIDAIAVPQQIARRGFPWKGVDDLLRRPLSKRVVGDVEVNDTAAIVTKDDEDEQDPERGSRQGEEIDGDQVLDMVVEKAPLRLRRWFSRRHVLGHGGLGNGYAQLRDFAVYPWRSPQRIGSGNIPDQLAHFRSDARSTRPAPPALPSPVAS